MTQGAENGAAQKVGVVVVTHGRLASELVNAAETIVGDLPHVVAVSIGWHDDATDARAEIAKAIGRVDQPGGVLILTDMFGGTPSNLSITFLEANRVEVITGVNLPTLIKLARLERTGSLAAFAQDVREHARGAIWVASEFLQVNASPDSGDAGETKQS
ncbi:MAG: PTS sugar transporter subunit IIA [Vicinamibacterales bacterium]|nr:PTS fructose transporter subunit IIA [Acidobacteriota bacterium]MDP6373247.1 PTS sugar transporter subunit IIA [Vicinamibacterales bacterium]MDP6608497.1 PTS sugar transporter subunit IIA [Vicinamibacterales bacterium]HAK56360.1 PTS fructose transporter subunit IIA [Acidobacteriota bacterium]